MATIFTVDDDPTIIELYREIMNLKGHHIIAEAVNGEEAVRTYSELEIKPDIIIMDYRMPKKDGLDAMKGIHEVNPMQYVLFITADDHAAKVAVENGAHGYIIKPFTLNLLMNALDSAIAEYPPVSTRA